MRVIKHKLGVLYWYLRKKYAQISYKCKKKYKSIKSFVIGFVVQNKIDFNRIKESKCLIICAHPDDETIFFHSIIRQMKPYIICMSNRGDKIRRKEFERALEYQGVSGTILNFPDMINIRWKWLKPFLIRKLKNIKKNAPDLEIIYTHNNVGESNHHHHFDLSVLVQKVFADKKIYLTSQYEIEENAISDYDDKEYIIRDIYKSQYKMLNSWCPWFEHYMRYEYFEGV